MTIYNTRQAAKFLGLKPSTLEVWRSRGGAELPFVKLGRTVRYREIDLLNFINGNIRQNTSQNEGLRS